MVITGVMSARLACFLGSFSHQDRFISGAVLLGVEQHEMAARGAFDPDGEDQVIILILTEGEVVTVGGRPAFEPEHGKAPYAERVRRAAGGTDPQAELLKCLRDFGDETLTPAHAPLYLHPARAEAGRRSQAALRPRLGGNHTECLILVNLSEHKLTGHGRPVCRPL
jgi:hypothetical protein